MAYVTFPQAEIISTLKALFLQGGSKIGPSPTVWIAGSPAIHVDLFGSILGAIGNLFPSTIAVLQTQIAQSLIDAGLSPETALGFVTNPLQTAGDLFKTSVTDPLEAALKEAADSVSKTATDALNGAVLEAQSIAGQINGTLYNVEFSDGVPTGILSNNPSNVFTVQNLANLPADSTIDLTKINSATSEFLKNQPILIQAAGKDLSNIATKLTSAAVGTAKELVQKELQDTTTKYFNDIKAETQKYQAQIYSATNTATIQAQSFVSKAYAAAAPIVKVNQNIQNKLAQASLPGYRALAATFSANVNLPVANKIVNLVDNAVAQQQNTTTDGIAKLAATKAAEGVKTVTGNIPGVNLRIVS